MAISISVLHVYISLSFKTLFFFTYRCSVVYHVTAEYNSEPSSAAMLVTNTVT